MNKNIWLLLFVFPFCSLAQSNPIKALNRYGEVVKEEFVYIQTDRPFYEPNESVYLNLFVVDNQTKKFSTQSSGISIEVLDPAGNKIRSANLLLEKKQVYFEFPIGQSGGIYKIRVRTPYTTFLDSSIYFEKEIQVQDIKYTQVLMDLELDKLSYHRGDVIGVKGLIKNRDGLLMRNTELNVSLLVNGIEDAIVPVKTDKEGRFKTEIKIKDTSGIYMLALLAKMDYAGIPISKFKHVPFVSGMLNVRFMPEGGWMLQGVESRVAFICKDLFGRPADVKGGIYNSNGSKVMDFESEYGGMGVFSFKPLEGQKYQARIHRIGEGDLILDLPDVLTSGTVIKGIRQNKESLGIELESTTAKTLQVVLRRGDTVLLVKRMDASKVGDVKFDLTTVQMGVHEIAVFDEDWNIKCTRRVFLRPDKRLNIQMTFSEKVYSVNQMASCKVKITDEAGNPVQTRFVFSVYNEQIKQYAEDNRENILSSLFLASEFEDEVHQPAYYFKDLDSVRLSHLDLLMMTHGWKRIQWHYATDAENEKYAKAMTFHGDPRVLSVNFVLKNNSIYYNDYFNPKKAKLICLNNGQEIPLNDNGFTLWGIDHNDALKFKLIYKNRFVYRFSEKSIPVKSLEPYQLNGIRYKEMKPFTIDTGIGIGLNSKRTKYKQPKLVLVSNFPEQVADKGKLNLGNDELIMMNSGWKSHELQKIDFSKVIVTESMDISSKTATMSCISIAPRYEVYDNGQTRYDKNIKTFMSHQLNVLQQQNLYPGFAFYGVQNLRGNLIYYNSEQSTDMHGNCTISFYLPKETVSCIASLESLEPEGKGGAEESGFSVNQPVSVLFNVPDKMVVEDKIKLPLIINSNLKSNSSLRINIARNYKNQLTEVLLDSNLIISHEQVLTFWVPLQTATVGYHTIYLNVTANGINQYLSYNVFVEPKGLPQTFVVSSNQQEYSKKLLLNNEIATNEFTVNVKLQKSMFSMFKENSENIIRQPSGCFEQVSSSNYPNLIAYQLIKQINHNKFLENKSSMESILRSGYSQLAAYETKEGGFEWYGNTPPHEGLTAFGLLQFHELKQTGLKVDEKLEKRTIKWLLSRFKSDGSINVNAGKYGFSGASELVTTAYVTYVLSVISDMDLSNQIQYIVRHNPENTDAYINVLLAGIYLNRGNTEKAKALLEINFNKMILMKFENISASHSIVRSGGKCLDLEIMGLTAYFAYQANAFQDQRKMTVLKLFESQNQYGFFGNTQSNVWAMKAIAEWFKVDKSFSESGYDDAPLNFMLKINGHEHLISSEILNGKTYSFNLPSDQLNKGENTIEVICKGLNERLYTISIEFETKKSNKDNGPLRLISECAVKQVRTAGVLQFDYQLINTRNTGLPQTVIVIPISSGIEVSPDQLRSMREMNLFDYYEIKNNQLILYYAELGPGEVRKIPITFKVICNGTFTVPEPSAYIYYQPELRAFGTIQTINVIE